MGKSEHIREINQENLFSFYMGLGGKSGFYTGGFDTIRMVKSPTGSWPSFLLGGAGINNSQLLEIFGQMREGKLPSFWIRRTDEDPEFDDFATWHGIRKINYWQGMYLMRDTPYRLQNPFPGIVMEELKSSQDLTEWVNLVNTGIMMNRQLEFDIFLNALNDPAFRFFRITDGSRTLSSLLMHTRSTETGIYLVSTALNERNKGLGTWITTSAIDLMINKGCKVFVLHATPMGYPVYHKLGFENCCDFGVYWMLGKKR